MKKLIQSLSYALVLSSLSFAAHSIEVTDNVHLHGFASQGYLYSPDAPYAGREAQDGSFDFREFGLNLSAELDDKTRMAFGVLNRSVGDSVKSKSSLDFLLIDRVIYQSAGSTFGLRVGRVKNDIGLYNSIRDIPSARPGIEIPKSVYFDSFRDTFLSVDGLNLYGNTVSVAGLVEWNVFYGHKDIDSNSLEYYALGGLSQGHYDVGRILGAKVFFEPTALSGFKVGLNFIKTNADLDNGPTANESTSQLTSKFSSLGINPMDGISPQEKLIIANEISNNLNQYAMKNENEINLAMLSMQFAFDNFLFSSEYLNIANKSLIIIPSLNGSEVTKNSGNVSGFFLQLEWFPSINWSALVRYEELVLDDKRNLKELARTYDETHGYQKALTLGTKWNFYENWSLSGEVSINDGTAWVPIYKGMENDQTKQHWKVYRAALSYQF